MTDKICVSCSTVNEAHFTYCKYCGAVLPVVDKLQKETPAPTEEKPSFEGISYYEYRHFIGSGADDILYDFNRLQNGAKFVFSLPLLFLGLFFGFFGISAWFFYRNLKKFGLFFLILGAVLTLGDTLVNFELYQTIATELAKIFGSQSANLFSSLSGLVSYYLASVVSLSQYVGFLAAFFISAVGLDIYKDKSSEKILQIKASLNETSMPLDLLLKYEGGTRPGLAVIPFAAAVILPMLFPVGLILIIIGVGAI